MTEQDLRQRGLDEEQTAFVLEAWRERELAGALGAYRFSSAAARENVFRQVRAAELSWKDGKPVGLETLMESIRKGDPDAFMPEAPRARFTMAAGPAEGPTREQIVKIPDRARRRAAIAENIRLFKGEN